MENIDLLALLRQLECSLHGVQRQDTDYLTECLHPDFMEISRSGTLSNRAETIIALVEQPTLQIHSENFKLHHLCPDQALLSYASYQIDPKTLQKIKYTLRASYWQLNNLQQWQLRFHQGTPA